mmetsp:Transcript_32147/g.76845  ORF Transcript_32147/g.76845 Transcript_32147/m.76845 type:complete len:200 (-) Transcript_32147:453-1052(-)
MFTRVEVDRVVTSREQHVHLMYGRRGVRRTHLSPESAKYSSGHVQIFTGLQLFVFQNITETGQFIEEGILCVPLKFSCVRRFIPCRAARMTIETFPALWDVRRKDRPRDEQALSRLDISGRHQTTAMHHRRGYRDGPDVRETERKPTAIVIEEEGGNVSDRRLGSSVFAAAFACRLPLLFTLDVSNLRQPSGVLFLRAF